MGPSLLPTENTAGHTRPWGHLRFALRSQTRPQAPGGGADSRPHSAVHPDTLEPSQEASFLLQLPAARSLVNKCGHPGKEGRLAAALVTARYGPHPGGGATSPTFLSCPSFF